MQAPMASDSEEWKKEKIWEEKREEGKPRRARWRQQRGLGEDQGVR